MKILRSTLLVLSLLLNCIYTVQAQERTVNYLNGHYSIIDSAAGHSGKLMYYSKILQWQHFKTSTYSRDVPKAVKQFYKDIADNGWQMADSGRDYNCCCDIDERLPSRQLYYLGYNENMVLINYIHGRGPRAAIMVAVFRLENNKVIDFCLANVGESQNDLFNRRTSIQQLEKASKEEVYKYVLDDM